MRLGDHWQRLVFAVSYDVMALICVKALVSQQGALRWQLFGFSQRL